MSEGKENTKKQGKYTKKEGVYPKLIVKKCRM